MAKFCSKCGTELNDSSAFCPNCGTSVGAPVAPAAPAAPAAPVSPAPEKPVREKKPRVAPVSAYTADNQKPSDAIQGLIDKIKANPKCLILPGAIVAGVLVLALVLSLVFGGGYTDALDNYVDLFMGKSSAIAKSAPDAYWDYMEEEEDTTLKELKETFEDEYDEQIEAMEEFFGKRVKLTYEVIEEDELSARKLKKIAESLADDYDMDVKVSEGYMIEVELLLKGSEEELEQTQEFTVLKIDGKWYLVNMYEYDGEYSVNFIVN